MLLGLLTLASQPPPPHPLYPLPTSVKHPSSQLHGTPLPTPSLAFAVAFSLPSSAWQKGGEETELREGENGKGTLLCVRGRGTRCRKSLEHVAAERNTPASHRAQRALPPV